MITIVVFALYHYIHDGSRRRVSYRVWLHRSETTLSTITHPVVALYIASDWLVDEKKGGKSPQFGQTGKALVKTKIWSNYVEI